MNMNNLNEATININYDYTDIVAMEDKSNRRLYINCEIDDCIASDIVNTILDINREDKETPIEKRKPILLYCTSCGGSVIDGFAIIDAIRTSITPIYTICLGYQYSMGFLIGIAGKKRFGTPNSTYLLHDGQNMVWDSSSKVRDRLRFEERREKRIKDYIISVTNITLEEYEKNLRVEWFMFSDEAKNKGVIDYIIGEDCTLEEIL